MQTKDSQSGPASLPAAQYVRMSDEAQQYSIDNQKTAIQEYANRHGFVIVKTYADVGKSGVLAKNRGALRELLGDVVSGNAKYKAVLVYDVSRWGRFPNNDEAAHYEFLCSSSGIPLHYCAEPFVNDGTASSSILKALKRSMAAEFSRELGEKVFRGKTRIVQLGFWVGGQPGYGYRRLMVSAEGKPKQIMKSGEHKSFTTDRVILTPGPRKEIECVRLIFSMAVDGQSGTAIARELNRRGILRNARLWERQDVMNILRNPKYTGCNVWRRGTQRLRCSRIRTAQREWITKQGAFVPIIDKDTFDRAQIAVPKRADITWTDKEIMQRVRRLLKREGRLSETLLLQARGMPAACTMRRHFGTYRQLYERVGYHFETEDLFRGEQAERSLEVRRRLVQTIAALFPEHVVVTHLPERNRSILMMDNSFMVSILLGRSIRRNGGPLQWVVAPSHAERDYITLLCTLNEKRDRVLNHYLLPRIEWLGRWQYLYKDDPHLEAATKLESLSNFYAAVKKLWGKRSHETQIS